MSETETSPAMISLGVSEVAPRAVGDLMHGLNTKEPASRLSPLFTPWKRAMSNAPRATAAAAALIEDYFKPMAERTFGDAALPKPERDATALAKWILKERPKVINARNIRRHIRLPGLREAKEVDAAISVLVEGGWLRTFPAREGRTAGRTRKDFEVNTALWGTGGK